LFTTGLQYLPLAEATAVNFLAPVLVTALSAPLLKERVTVGQWVAVVWALSACWWWCTRVGRCSPRPFCTVRFGVGLLLLPTADAHSGGA
jgi:hypothetical protein